MQNIMTRELIGERLKQLRLDLGFSQTYVSDIISADQASLSTFEKGTGGGLNMFIDLINFYGKYYRISNVLTQDFVIMKREETPDMESVCRKMLSEVAELKRMNELQRAKLVNIQIIGSAIEAEP